MAGKGKSKESARRSLERVATKADENDLRIASEAQKKVKRGLRLTAQERAATKRVEAVIAAEEFRRLAEHVQSKTLEELLETPRKTLLEWGRAGMPRNRDKRRTYDLYKVLPWLRDRWRKGAEEEGADARLKRLRGDKLQLDIDHWRGLLIDAEDVEREGKQIVTVVVQRLTNLPQQIAGRLANCDAAEIQTELSERIHEILSGLADHFDAYGRETGDDE